MIAVYAVSVLFYMILFYAAARKTHNYGVVDIGWGGGFVLLAIIGRIDHPQGDLRQMIATLLVMVWGLRLIIHVFRRNQTH